MYIYIYIYIYDGLKKLLRPVAVIIIALAWSQNKSIFIGGTTTFSPKCYSDIGNMIGMPEKVKQIQEITTTCKIWTRALTK